MRKRPMCLACLGFMLVLVLLRIAGVPLGLFLIPNTKTKRSRAGRCGLQGQLKRMRKRAATTGMCCAGREAKGKFICSQSGEICRSEPLCGCTEL